VEIFRLEFFRERTYSSRLCIALSSAALVTAAQNVQAMLTFLRRAIMRGQPESPVDPLCAEAQTFLARSMLS
jgi:hypothetical protein